MLDGLSYLPASFHWWQTLELGAKSIWQGSHGRYISRAEIAADVVSLPSPRAVAPVWLPPHPLGIVMPPAKTRWKVHYCFFIFNAFCKCHSVFMVHRFWFYSTRIRRKHPQTSCRTFFIVLFAYSTLKFCYWTLSSIVLQVTQLLSESKDYFSVSWELFFIYHQNCTDLNQMNYIMINQLIF